MKEFPLVLSIDTATPFLVLGLADFEESIRLERKHAEKIWPLLTGFLAKHDTKLSDLSGVAVGTGPGSYTGLRVAVSAGLGLARGLRIPVCGVGTLEGAGYAACQKSGGAPTWVAHTTRNGLCYAAQYALAGDGQLVTITPPHKRVLEEIPTDTPSYFDEPPSGAAMSKLGRLKLLNEELKIQPLYL